MTTVEKPKRARWPFIILLLISLGCLGFTALRWYEVSKYNTAASSFVDSLLIKSGGIDTTPSSAEGKRLAQTLSDERTRKTFNLMLESTYPTKAVVGHKALIADVVIVHADESCKDLAMYHNDGGRKLYKFRLINYGNGTLLLNEAGVALSLVHSLCRCAK